MVLAIPNYSFAGSGHMQIALLQIFFNSTQAAHLKFLKSKSCLFNELRVARYSRDSGWFLRLLKKNKKVLDASQKSINWLVHPLLIYYSRVRLKYSNHAKTDFSAHIKRVKPFFGAMRYFQKTALKSHFGSGGINGPESPKDQKKAGESSSQSFIRFKYLLGFFRNQIFWQKILQSIALSDFSFVVLKQNQTKLIQLAAELAILSVFNHNIQGQKLQYSNEQLFLLAFPWLFHLQTGSYIELMLAQHIKTQEAKNKFKRLFLAFQRRYSLCFEPKEEISERSFLSTQIYFKKINLCRVIRLLMPLYQHSFWETISSREKYVFISAPRNEKYYCVNVKSRFI